MAAMKTVTVKATGPDGWVVKTVAGKHEAFIDQPEAMGGTDTAPTPLDYIFVALGGCLVTIAKIVAMQRKIDLRGVEVDVSGEINLEVLRGQNTVDRAGFESMTAVVKIDADLSDEEKEEFLEEVDRRCPVSDNLMKETPITVKLA
jgi:putative redox protein